MQQSKIKVLDAPMGTGKSCGAIDHMNAHPEKRYIFATQYLDECERVQRGCPKLNFQMTSSDEHTKSCDAVELIKAGVNIAITHSLLGLFTIETIEAIRGAGYTLILDEAFEAMKRLPESESDQKMLMNRGILTVDEESGIVSWNETEYKSDGIFTETRKMIERGGVVKTSDGCMEWRYPREVFEVFDQVFILTYMFDASPLYYYLAIEGLSFAYIGVRKLPSGLREFCPVGEADQPHLDVRSKIHLIEDDDRNSIGDRYNAMSVSSYKRDLSKKGHPMIKAIRDIVRNVLRTDWNAVPKSDVMWSSFKDPAPLLKREPASGNDKNRRSRLRIYGSFVEMNCRAKNQFGHIHHLIYLCNVFMPTEIKMMLSNHGILVDNSTEDKYATSVMVQWIWRSAIRNGEEIWLYLPSSRMRSLLKKWIDKVEGVS